MTVGDFVIKLRPVRHNAINIASLVCVEHSKKGDPRITRNTNRLTDVYFVSEDVELINKKTDHWFQEMFIRNKGRLSPGSRL